MCKTNHVVWASPYEGPGHLMRGHLMKGLFLGLTVVPSMCTCHQPGTLTRFHKRLCISLPQKDFSPSTQKALYYLFTKIVGIITLDLAGGTPLESIWIVSKILIILVEVSLTKIKVACPELLWKLTGKKLTVTLMSKG